MRAAEVERTWRDIRCQRHSSVGALSPMATDEPGARG
jgi:hypothetical protein